MTDYRIPEHPVIRALERTGWPDGREPKYPVCPQCFNECEKIYFKHGKIIGCEDCVPYQNAWDVPECFPDDGEE